MLVEIVARSLFLISDGDVDLPYALPSNIASRHRICTTIAARVKDAGFIGDCGYNQLLYPLEQQTRALLNWLVQKLPRSQEERVEEALGANAAMNKRIVETLDAWRQTPFRLHICATGKPARNICLHHHFRTAPTKLLMERRMKEICDTVRKHSITLAPSIFELNGIETVLEADSTDLLTEMSGCLDPRQLRTKARRARGGNPNSMLSDVVKDSVRASIVAAKVGNSGYDFSSKGGLTFDSNYKDPSGISSMSFQELLDHMSEKNRSSDGTSGRGTRFLHATEFSQESELGIGGGGPSVAPKSSSSAQDTPVDGIAETKKEEDPAFREAFLEDLRNQIQKDITNLEAQRKHSNNLSEKFRLVDGDLSGLTDHSGALEKEILLKRKVLEMLPNATENIQKLQEICAASGKRLLELGQEWETHRRALIERLRKPKGAKTERKLKCKTMLNEMKQFREEMQHMVADLKEKQDRAQALRDELDKLPRNINRNLYTFRIMDIIAQVGKQNREIEKIVGDIHSVQKDINQSNSSLQRADAIAEEKVYSAANSPNSDPAMTDTYRHLRKLRSNFEALISTVEKIGIQDKIARGLETKIDQEQTRVSANNFDRISSDLEQIKNENNELLAQLKAK